VPGSPCSPCSTLLARPTEQGEPPWPKHARSQSRQNFESPTRLERTGPAGNPPPPIFKDELYGLGLSIWQLYTWRIPHEGIAGCGMELKDRRTIGGTLDMAEVDDEEARGMITKLLRTGGARICVHTVFTDCPCCSNCTYRNRKPVLSLPSAVGNHLAAVDWVPPLRSALGTSPPKLPTCQVRQQPTYQVDPLASQVINPSLDPDWACLAYEGQCLVLMHEGDGRGT